MPEIRMTSAFLTINDGHLDRNFRFNIINSSNFLQKIANIYIKRNYFLANRITINRGDKVFISLQNNMEDKVLIFSGIVQATSSTAHEIHLKARFDAMKNDSSDPPILNETYMDTSLDKVIEILCPHSDYQAQDKGKERRQIVVQGQKEPSLYRLLRDKYFYLDLNDKLIVLDKPKAGRNFIVDQCLYSAEANSITIFPIPQLEINDTVEYQGNMYIVRHIAYNYLSKAQMTLHVKNYEAPPLEMQKMDIEPKGFIFRKPEPKEEDLFENPEKLDELQSNDNPNPDKPSPDARKHFIDVARAVYKDYQNIGKEHEFQKIYITSAWRSKTKQRDILLGKIGLKGESSMYEYYKTRAPKSAPYLKIMQYLYDGVYISLPEGDKYETVVPESDYLAIEALYGKKEGKAKREIFQSIVHGYMDYFLNRVDKEDRKIGVTKVLDDSYVNSTTYLFNPSFHVTDTENKNSSALDIRTYSPYTDTAAKFYDQHLALGYGGYRGSDHNHMSYRWKT